MFAIASPIMFDDGTDYEYVESYSAWKARNVFVLPPVVEAGLSWEDPDDKQQK